ncbi:MAG: hypothetical protein L0271_14190 [Gemmatimonadetes bacterium]|nr:hypothetical protein [Gemmatimonadota bacterium]
MLGPAVRSSGSLLLGFLIASAAAAAPRSDETRMNPYRDSFVPVFTAEALTAGPDGPFIVAAPAIAFIASSCAPQLAVPGHAEDDDKPRKKPWRVLGWLYRAFGHGEASRQESPPLLLYLRSPLLAGFAEEADCPENRKPVKAPRCEAVPVLAHKSGTRTVDAILPQLGASTAAELIDAVQSRLDEGAAVTLRTTRGREAVLLPDVDDEVMVTACDERVRPEVAGGRDFV